MLPPCCCRLAAAVLLPCCRRARAVTYCDTWRHEAAHGTSSTAASCKALLRGARPHPSNMLKNSFAYAALSRGLAASSF